MLGLELRYLLLSLLFAGQLLLRGGRALLACKSLFMWRGFDSLQCQLVLSSLKRQLKISNDGLELLYLQLKLLNLVLLGLKLLSQVMFIVLLFLNDFVDFLNLFFEAGEVLVDFEFLVPQPFHFLLHFASDLQNTVQFLFHLAELFSSRLEVSLSFPPKLLQFL